MRNGFAVGIDIGSRYIKIVLLKDGKIIQYQVEKSGIDPFTTANILLSADERYNDAPICTTGYGRKLLDTPYVSEICCHAIAVKTLIPKSRIVIDIGGQDSKVIILNEEGNVVDFVMNDKCAAGTGSFLESIAGLCTIPIENIGEKALSSKISLKISSTCVVFAESEIISLINRKHKIEDILMAVHFTIAGRIKNMLSNSTLKKLKSSGDEGGKIVMTGGVANNRAMVYALEKTLGERIIVPPTPSITGALGAGIYAYSIQS